MQLSPYAKQCEIVNIFNSTLQFYSETFPPVDIQPTTEQIILKHDWCYTPIEFDEYNTLLNEYMESELPVDPPFGIKSGYYLKTDGVAIIFNILFAVVASESAVTEERIHFITNQIKWKPQIFYMKLPKGVSRTYAMWAFSIAASPISNVHDIDRPLLALYILNKYIQH